MNEEAVEKDSTPTEPFDDRIIVAGAPDLHGQYDLWPSFLKLYTPGVGQAFNWGSVERELDRTAKVQDSLRRTVAALREELQKPEVQAAVTVLRAAYARVRESADSRSLPDPVGE